ncbi:hypothetical protein QR680_017154 [Steinernema hermaphroditum]|uniref:HTH TFE/IIEalpha-type domain-containing protein n=1 Tax=Steinernema hermaphroditum TaxID=289476 RepID=A0AA39HFI7_9BILA|nr:hypothetical protein QR680_017154 [Steinernema hermaphroditum]
MTETEANGETRIQVVNEVPENLKRLTLFITKAFYGVEHYVLVDYLQRNICIKEDQLRDITRMDSRVLRQLLVQLKVDKIVKERVVAVEQQPPPNGGRAGKPRRVSYYFVNYKAVLNVARYKIDHMRQKLESREKNDVNKANYKCTSEGCEATYQSLEIDQLIDMTTGDMRCWRCQGLVENDQAAGPTDLTRTSLAKFNDQMAALFSMMQSLDGIRLAQHLLEPPVQNINTAPQEEAEENKKKFVQVGAKAFGGHGTSRKDMFNQEVTVNIINGNVPLSVVEEKESVPWLSANSNFDSSELNQRPALGYASSSAPVLSYAQQEQQRPANHLHNAESTSRLPEVRALLNLEKDLLKEHEERKKAEDVERPRYPVTFTLEDNDEEMDYEDDEDFIQLTIQGEPIDFEKLTDDPELVYQMTEAEKNLYVRVWREHMEFC